MYKAVLQNDLVQDPDERLKKYFLKSATNVCICTGSSVSSIVEGRTNSSSFLHQNSKSFF